MILAAGRGERMRPLTDICPKPLLKVADIPLIEHHIRKLARAGITDIVINHAWLGEQIVQYLGDGSQWQVNIVYSPESNGALETAGGIIKALPLLIGKELIGKELIGKEVIGEKAIDGKVIEADCENDVFIVVNADIYTGFDFTELPKLSDDCLAHLWLVENPSHNENGDFSLIERTGLPGLLSNPSSTKPSTSSFQGNKNEETYTFSGIGLYHYRFFQQQFSENDILPLAPLLKQAADQGKITASVLSCGWTDVGTPDRLAELN